MIPAEVRTQLLDRRERIEKVITDGGPGPQLEGLLHDIDNALERFAHGTYGLCETCGDPIEEDRLEADPLVRFCLDHLTPSQARALEQDLQLASRVQLNLLPPSELVVDGWQMAYHYEPLSTVSGDYVDIVRPSGHDEELYFLFGDIAGKGVAASMLMAHLHASVRTLIDLGLPLAQVMERANRVFCESTMANHYATLVCGRLSSNGDVEISNAGHCPPIHLHDRRATTIEATSLPVGLFCANEYCCRQFRMAPGDSLVLYTDGISEAEDAAGRDYGADRLLATAAGHATSMPSDLVSACMKDLDSFRAGALRQDDLTLMAIRRA
jgi:sigma-B regulation protein RsbU (phosphoserine phosphatase)